MTDPAPQHRTIARLASLALVLEVALGLRVAAADMIQWYVQRKERLCVFPDTEIYWHLARTVVKGEPFEVTFWGNKPHFALRTPGYPLFLAACQAVSGESTLAVRLAQVVLGTLSVWLVYGLTRAVTRGGSKRGGWTVPLIAAALAACEPYTVFTSALILSEAVFVPLMLASLWGLAVLWTARGDESPRWWWAWALGVGAASGGAVLVRPSWALFVPAVLAAWALFAPHRVRALRGSVVIVLGFALVMAPWWARNARVFGRFVPTALWMGASLYDGLNPRATGASDMEFLNEPDLWPLSEEQQDAELTRRALAFVRAHPGRSLRLAGVKLLRYWSPWPNAEGFRSRALAVASALVSLPIFALWAAGAWDRRRDPRALVLLAGPLVYFCALHMVFAGSMRYRIPAAAPAFGLAAIGWKRMSNGMPNPREQSTDDTD